MSGGGVGGGMSSGSGLGSAGLVDSSGGGQQQSDEQQQPTGAGNDPPTPSIKKSRTNTPGSPAEEAMLRQKRDQGQTWGEIAKALSQVRMISPSHIRYAVNSMIES